MYTSGQDRVKKWMKKNRLTFRKAEEISGVSRAHINQIVTGQRRITDRTAPRLAEAMGIKYWWRLIDREGTE